jgi:hypothetical protein
MQQALWGNEKCIYPEHLLNIMYFRIRVKRQDYVQEEIKRVLNMGGGGGVVATIHLSLSYSLLEFKNVKIEICTIIGLPVVLYGHENHSLSLSPPPP